MLEGVSMNVGEQTFQAARSHTRKGEVRGTVCKILPSTGQIVDCSVPTHSAQVRINQIKSVSGSWVVSTRILDKYCSPL